MKYAVLIYTDATLVDALPQPQYDARMRDCLAHADELRRDGQLHDSQQLEDASTAKTIRVRNDRRTVVDGPFAETKEVLGGFNIIEAADMDEAVRIASEFPWAQTGCIEVRPVRDIDTVRRRVAKAS